MPEWIRWADVKAKMEARRAAATAAAATTDIPQPGDIGLCRVDGPVGRLIHTLQILNGDGACEFGHVIVAIRANKTNTAVLCAQAQPGGANLQWFPVEHAKWGKLNLTRYQRGRIVKAARSYLGTPYSFMDYFALLLHRLRIPAPFLARYIQSTRHMICSQYADQCYRDAGVVLFTDGRWPGYVTPAALYHRLFTTPCGCEGRATA